MRVAVVGSRDYPDLEAVRAYVRAQPADTVIISGGARGVDQVAVDTARRLQLAYEVYPADWTRYGKRAGFLRNITIVDNADAVVAFWDGVSRGTKHTIDYANERRKLARVFRSLPPVAHDRGDEPAE